MQEYANKHCSIDVIYILRGVCKEETSVYILKLCRKTGKCFEDSLRGDSKSLTKFRSIVYLLGNEGDR